MKNTVTGFLMLILCSILNFSYAQTENKDLLKLDSAYRLIEVNKADLAINIVKQLSKSSMPEVALKANRMMAEILIKRKDFEAAKKLLEATRQNANLLFNIEEEASCLYLLARIEALIGNFENAISMAEKGQSKAVFLTDLKLLYKIKNILSWAYFSTSTDFDKILQHEKELYQLVNKIGNENDKAFIFNNVGYDLTVAGTVSLDSLVNMTLFANSTFAKNENNEGRWYSLMNLTWQYRLKNKLDSSVFYGIKAYNQAVKDDDRHAIIETSFQLADTYYALGRTKKAEKYYNLGLAKRGDKEDRDRYVFDVYYANFLWLQGEKKQAITMLEQAISFLKNSEVFYEMHGRALLASFYWENNEFDKASNQLFLIENPRNNYISLETRCLAAIIRAKYLAQTDQHAYAESLLRSWKKHLDINKFNYLSLLVSKEVSSLKK